VLQARGEGGAYESALRLHSAGPFTQTPSLRSFHPRHQMELSTRWSRQSQPANAEHAQIPESPDVHTLRWHICSCGAALRSFGCFELRSCAG
jgi:hypothetical protein